MQTLIQKKTAETDADVTKPTLGYWDVRGKGAQVHYVLAYCGVDYNSKVYIRGPPPEFSKSDWVSHRAELNLDFPNLPYYMEPNVKYLDKICLKFNSVES